MIPIDEMLIRRITRLPYQGRGPIEESVDKNQENAMTYTMKDKFGIIKMSCGYDINSIRDQGVRFTKHILARKIMRKFKENEVLVTMVSLAAYCSVGVQFN